MQRYVPVAAFTLALLAPLGRPVLAQVDVTTCGQMVPAGQVGTLVADLDCSASPGNGVELGAGATLDLNGFRLTGNPGAPFNSAHGVLCDGTCTVVGPGAVESFPGDGIFASDTVRVHAAALLTNGNTGIEGDGIRRIAVDGGTFYRNAAFGIYTGGYVVVSGSTFVSNGAGINGLGVIVSESTFSSNGGGLNSDGHARIRMSTFTNNSSYAVQAQRAVVQACSMDGNGIAVNTHRAIVRESTITGTVLSGIDSVMARVADSTVTGSGSGCTTPGFPCADVDTRERPIVVRTTCDTSLQWQTHQPWGVCQND